MHKLEELEKYDMLFIFTRRYLRLQALIKSSISIEKDLKQFPKWWTVDDGEMSFSWNVSYVFITNSRFIYSSCCNTLIVSTNVPLLVSISQEFSQRMYSNFVRGQTFTSWAFSSRVFLTLLLQNEWHHC